MKFHSDAVGRVYVTDLCLPCARPIFVNNFDEIFCSVLNCFVLWLSQGEWIDESAIYQSQEQFTTSNSCVCNKQGGEKRAPLLSNHVDAMNAALQNGISVVSIRTT